MAEAWLRSTLEDARRGALEPAERSGATFADAAAEWLRYIEQDRQRKPSTVGGYSSIVRTQLLPAFGPMAIESVMPDTIDAWLARTGGSASSRRKSLVLLHGIFRRARKLWGLRVNPVDDVEKPPLQRSGNIDVFCPEEVWALARAAASEQGAAIYLTAAFTGLRWASCWRSGGPRQHTTPSPSMLGFGAAIACRGRLSTDALEWRHLQMRASVWSPMGAAAQPPSLRPKRMQPAQTRLSAARRGPAGCVQSGRGA